MVKSNCTTAPTTIEVDQYSYKTELAHVGGHFNGQLDEYRVGEEVFRRAWRVGGVSGLGRSFQRNVRRAAAGGLGRS